MTGLFLSTFVNKIDKKCRVSVPASFRAVLANGKFPGIVIYESLINDSIEASGFDRIGKLNELIDKLEPFSPERDALATSVLANSILLTFDPEGRVILPLELMNKIDLSDEACFVGKGTTFEIWQPQKFAIYKEKAKELAKNYRSLLSNNHQIQEKG